MNTNSRKWRSIVVSIRNIFSVFAIMSLVFCGIFSPRDVQEPLGLPSEPIRLSTILDNTGRSFAKVMREEIIHPDCVYKDEYSSAQDALELKFRLDDIEYSYDSIYVKWNKDTIGHLRDDLQTDSMTVYRVFMVWLDGDSLSTADYFGRSIFKIKPDDITGEWFIVRWDDTPVDSILNPLGVGYKSFFNPEY